MFLKGTVTGEAINAAQKNVITLYLLYRTFKRMKKYFKLNGTFIVT